MLLRRFRIWISDAHRHTASIQSNPLPAWKVFPDSGKEHNRMQKFCTNRSHNNCVTQCDSQNDSQCDSYSKTIVKHTITIHLTAGNGVIRFREKFSRRSSFTQKISQMSFKEVRPALFFTCFISDCLWWNGTGGWHQLGSGRLIGALF